MTSEEARISDSNQDKAIQLEPCQIKILRGYQSSLQCLRSHVWQGLALLGCYCLQCVVHLRVDAHLCHNIQGSIFTNAHFSPKVDADYKEVREEL